MKIQIVEASGGPIYFPSILEKADYEAEVSKETAERWNRIADDWEQMQKEIEKVINQ